MQPAPMEPVRKRAALRIRSMRQARGWSMAELSELSGVHRVTIHKIENLKGRYRPQHMTLVMLAKALGCEWEDLVGEKVG